MTIDWDYLTECYNKNNKTKFKSSKDMVESLYDKRGSCDKVGAFELLVSSQSVYNKMKEDGSQLKPKGWRGLSMCKIAIVNIDPAIIKSMTCIEISSKIGFSNGHTRRSLDDLGTEYKKHWIRRKVKVKDE